jgi:hypothetical protein
MQTNARVKTGLSILEGVLLSLPGASPEKIIYAGSFDYGNDNPEITLFMKYEGVVCGQTSGASMGKLYGPERWEAKKGICLNGNKKFDEYLFEAEYGNILKLVEKKLFEIVEKSGMKSSPDKVMLVKTSGYEDRGHYQEGIYSQGVFLVPKSPVIEKMRKADEDFTEKLIPHTSYLISEGSGSFSYKFPTLEGWRFDGTSVVRKSFSSETCGLKLISENHLKDIERLEDHLFSLNKKFEKRCRRRGKGETYYQQWGITFVREGDEDV